MGCNSCSNKKENVKNKEDFYSSPEFSNYLSNNWILIVIGLIIIIGLIYLFILIPKSELNKILEDIV
jgi:hypothetical protein